MIRGWFELHLDCSCDACDDARWVCGYMSSHIYKGSSWRDIIRQAWLDGWRISRDRRKVYLPGHAADADTVGRLDGCHG